MESLKTCPLCGTEEGAVPFLVCGDPLLKTGSYSIVQCVNCNVLYTNPRPKEKELLSYYKSEKYFSHSEQKNSLDHCLYFRVQSLIMKRKLRLINKLSLNGKYLLDVGCGVGAFGEHMQNAGYQVINIEPHLAAREKAQQKNLYVYENLEALKHDGKSGFDVITLWHVLEHQPHFMKNLEEFHNLLNDNGALIIAVPQYKSFDAGYYESDWAGYDLPRHLTHFSEKTLANAAMQKGFQLVFKKGMPFDAFYVSMLSEKYRGRSLPGIRGAIVGLWSNLVALLKLKPFSSQIFVFHKG